ncbi:MAG: hypothetical protein J6T42_04720, partial [Clostridia bacterium]|nr:hypothetical protein [Clostridia bacterium]
MIVQVIVDIAHSEVDKIFDYDCRVDNVTVGSRVIVPFGNMKIEGVVIGVKDKSDLPAERLKPVLRALDFVPAITLEGLALMRFMANKYHLPNAAILRLFLPTEMRKGKVREKLVSFAFLTEREKADELLLSLKKNAVAKRGAIEKLKSVEFF